MRIGIPAEIYPGETRVAATPETVKKLSAGGRHAVMVEAGAGVQASIPDAEFVAAGAALGCAADIYSQSDIILKVRGPEAAELPLLRRGSMLVGLLSPHLGVEPLAQAGVTAFAMELLPRISRAQGMDVLSSQGNIAGYKAVILAANEYARFMPMLMTAAGTVKAARVLILGAGVAGLQAIATAKRLGAVIEAFDVRPAVKEQVESLGAKFVEVALSDEETAIRRNVGWLRPRDERRLQAAAGGAHRRTRQSRRHCHHHRADSRPPGSPARHRRHAQGHEARLGRRRPCRQAGRQLRRQRGRHSSPSATA